MLVLGDSFSNIYSLESMGWGDSAGFIEHLGYALARPLDRIVRMIRRRLRDERCCSAAVPAGSMASASSSGSSRPVDFYFFFFELARLGSGR